jgi:hypothetical protein
MNAHLLPNTQQVKSLRDLRALEATLPARATAAKPASRTFVPKIRERPAVAAATTLPGAAAEAAVGIPFAVLCVRLCCCVLLN